MKPEEPVISDRFDIYDIRKIREFDSRRHLCMTTAEIIAEVNGNAEEMIKRYDLKPLNLMDGVGIIR